MTSLFGQTLREAPSEAHTISQQWLQRANYIRSTPIPGVFCHLRLGERTLTKIIDLIRSEFRYLIGGQEIILPINISLPELIADLLHKDIHSYKQLPRLLYSFSTGFRENIRSKLGLIHSQEYPACYTFSIDIDSAGMNDQYEELLWTYQTIFERCGIKPKLSQVASEREWGNDSNATAFIFPISSGDKTILSCGRCGYAADQKIARQMKDHPPVETPKLLEKVSTPECKTIEDLSNFLIINKSKTAKAIFLIGKIPESEKDLSVDEKSSSHHLTVFIFIIIRGDMELNEYKLQNLIHASSLHPATDDEILSAGAVPGYASPICLNPFSNSLPMLLIVDDQVMQSPNLVAGANEEGYHLINVNYGRDYQADIIADIAYVHPGDPCPECGDPLRSNRGVEIARFQRLTENFSPINGCTYQDEYGTEKVICLGTSRLDLSCLLACIAENHHDDRGLLMPRAITPYIVYLIWLPDKKDSKPYAIAEQAYAMLKSASIDVLFDDRDERPGIKFNDSDLFGIPIRITVSSRSLIAGGVEIKRRDQDESRIIPVDQIITNVKTILEVLL
ncbi:MAG: YbaK/EbsC family protein [Chloroflexota bacterium]